MAKVVGRKQFELFEEEGNPEVVAEVIIKLLASEEKGPAIKVDVKGSLNHGDLVELFTHLAEEAKKQGE